MTEEGTREPRIDTRALHAGEDPARDAGAVVGPIHRSATFLYPDRDRPLRYTRYGNNPTQIAVQTKLAALEGAEAALVLASGMAALATAVLSVCGSGDHILAAPDLYGGTHLLLDRELPRLGIETTYVDGHAPESWAAGTRPNTRLFLWESISNPLLRVPDGPEIATLARDRGIVTLVDATFATPVNQRPIGFGADLVMHSATKYLGGHSDLIGGILGGSRERIEAAVERMKSFGGSADPGAVFLLDRGLKTLALRMARHGENGRTVADFLADHPRVERVHYPERPDHPDREIASRVLQGSGGVVTFVPRASPAEAEEITGRFRWIRRAPSLGGVESLVSMPALTSHRSLSSEERARRGIPDETIRLALGVEAPEDLVADIDRALSG